MKEVQRSLNMPDGTRLDFLDNLVIVGANGSGKSRFGARIKELNSDQPVKRISAQRVLNAPDQAQMLALQQALDHLMQAMPAHFANSSVDDYNSVVAGLFAELAQRDNDYVSASRLDVGDKKLPVPKSAIDKFLEIWSDIMPHLDLKLEKNMLKVKTDSYEYGASSMSDGERVALYLLSQCLILPQKCVIIIDEPEIHLHRALMNNLWNALEKQRPDCIFIYITHDLEFAAGRIKAEKIWLRKYESTSSGNLLDHSKWEFEMIHPDDSLPENLILQVVGSRKPILFTEGENSTSKPYDKLIYQLVYSDFTVLPRSGGEQVILSVNGMKANRSLHHLECFGIVDRDYKEEAQIQHLSKKGIYVLDFSEIENVLLVPEVIKLVAKQLALDPETIFEKVKVYVFEQFASKMESLISFRTSLRVNFLLNAFDQKQLGVENIEKSVQSLGSSMDVKKIYSDNAKIYNDILTNKDYMGLLKYFNQKGLMAEISPFFTSKYPDLVMRMLNHKDTSEDLKKIMLSYLPVIKL